MQQYSTFIFDSYAFDPAEGVIRLNYSLNDQVQFTETLTLPRHSTFDIRSSPNLNSEQLDRALLLLHLLGGISYYKTCLPKTIEVRSGTLDAKQTEFLNTVYLNGLGEFFFKNQINFRGLINFPTSDQESEVSDQNPNQPINPSTKKRVLVPIGGGKDSVVTFERLRSSGYDVTLFRLGSHPLLDDMAKIADLPMITAERQLSPALFELNQQGALNGHVPITGYISALTVVLSIIYGFDAVAMSNEHSANYGNVEYLGMEINHQWSKGVEFERMFQQYVRTYVTRDVEYFSLLRPLTELAIVRQFTRYPQYLAAATSCNVNWKILKENRLQGTKWCGTCPKCAFVFALYAAFLPKDKVVEIFGGNLLDDPALLPLYRQLLDLEGFKPFECVGTPEETMAALILAHEQGGWDDTVVMKMAKEEVDLPDDLHALIEQEMSPTHDHAIPEAYRSTIL